MRIGYQGVNGAFSEMALLGFFKDKIDVNNIEEVSFSEFPDMFAAVERGDIDYGMFPVENTTTGMITRTYDFFQFYDVFAMGEINVPINQNLIAFPGAKLSEIKEVFSHPEAILQCSGFFRKNPHLRPVVYEDTALSVKHIKEMGDPTKAAIASSRASECFGIPILMEKVQDNTANMTRFLVVTKSKEIPEGADKVSIMLTLKHNPGALYHALGVFAGKQINVLKVESRPIVGKVFEYCFYVDFQGNLNDPDVKEVIRRLEYDSLNLRILGNYRAAAL